MTTTTSIDMISHCGYRPMRFVNVIYKSTSYLVEVVVRKENVFGREIVKNDFWLSLTGGKVKLLMMEKDNLIEDQDIEDIVNRHMDAWVDTYNEVIYRIV